MLTSIHTHMHTHAHIHTTYTHIYTHAYTHMHTTRTHTTTHMHAHTHTYVQPQNSIPDVIIWMLAGGKRVAFCRIPSNLLMYCGVGSQTRGSKCGTTQTIFLTVSLVSMNSHCHNLKFMNITTKQPAL